MGRTYKYKAFSNREMSRLCKTTRKEAGQNFTTKSFLISEYLQHDQIKEHEIGQLTLYEK
jgi:hypothetical protein